MKRNHPARGGAGNAEQMGNLHRHYTASREDDTSRPRAGDIVHAPGVGRCHVVAVDDPSLIRVQNARGVEFKVGERSVTRLEVRHG